jgi:FkbM family methyltransferase
MSSISWSSQFSHRWFNTQAWALRFQKCKARLQTSDRYLPVRALNRELRLPTIAHRQFWSGDHSDEATLAFLADALPDNGVFFDIGANIGVYSTALWLAKQENLRIQAFEPIPSTVNVLTEMFQLNQVNAAVNAIALSNSEGTLTLSAYEEGANNFWVMDIDADLPTLTVPTMTLDDWMLAHPDCIPNAIKIDVEGHELSVLKGAQATLSAYKPALMLECHCASWDDLGVSRQEITELLAEIGYQVRDRNGNDIDLMTRRSTVHALCTVE